jgi:hypothetical protein
VKAEEDGHTGARGRGRKAGRHVKAQEDRQAWEGRGRRAGRHVKAEEDRQADM